jgi:hypothetical protein
MTSATLMISEIDAGKPQRQRRHQICAGAACWRSRSLSCQPPPSFLQRPGRGAPAPHPLPAGGTTAGLPNPSTPGEASRVANMLLWHFLCQK